MDAKKSALLLLLVLGVPGCVAYDASAQTGFCMSTCLSNFQSILSGVNNQVTACTYVPTYFSCLKSYCNLGDVTPYLPSLQQLLSSRSFTCDLSRSVYGSNQVQISPMCIATCESAFQSNIAAASSQVMACAIADSYMNCLQSSCNADSSQYVSHMNLGLMQQGFTTCDGSSDNADAEPPATPSRSPTVSCSVLQVIAVLMIAFFYKQMCLPLAFLN